MAETHTAIIYGRVSTREQAESGLGLKAQQQACADYAKTRGWYDAYYQDAGVPGSVHPSDRTGLGAALQALKKGAAQTLIAQRVDRLGRRASDVIQLAETADKEGWNLVVLDLGLDTSTPTGRMMLTVIAGVAEMERSLISVRTKEALAEAKKQGTRLGRPARRDQYAESIRKFIHFYHKQGIGTTEIARNLNIHNAAPLGSGKKWYPSSVAAVLRTNKNDQIAQNSIDRKTSENQKK